MGRIKSGGFVYNRYAAKTQNIVNIISNVCVNLVLQKIKFKQLKISWRYT